MNIKSFTPHLIAIAALLLLSAVFFAPNAFSGKVLPQGDNDKARGMQTEVKYYMDKTGEAPKWTNSAFGGMPAFQIYSPAEGNWTRPFYKALFLGTDYTASWAQVFIAMLCMYLLLSVLRLNWRTALFGALAYGFTTYNADILEAGHSTKMAALAIMPGVLAGAVMAFNGRALLGAGVTALFLGMQLYANHIQITYYTLILVGFYWLAQLVNAFRHKSFMQWGQAFALTALGIVLAFGTSMSRLWSTYEYGAETIRGKSELSNKAAKGDGLDKDYLFGWSSGIAESMTLLVPHAYGGGAGETITDTEFFDMMSKGASPAEKKQIARQTASVYYHGSQPFVGTAIYFGAIVCFLFVMGAFLARGPEKWWLLTGGIFMIMLAWGKHFFLNDILYSALPMFNKFRAVTMAFGIAQMCFAGLAAFGLQKFFDADISMDKKKMALYAGLGITGLLCLIAAFTGGGSGPNDAELAAQIKMPNLAAVLESDRSALARSDAFRSLGFILVAAALLWMSMRGALKAGISVLVISALALADHWLVCQRTLTFDKYEAKRSVMAPPKEEAFDKQIKQDKDLHYRVLDLSRGSIAGNATTSYFHKSLSGYHAAKLQRYQEVVDSFLGSKLGDHIHLVGMFNGKYLITPKGDVLPNPQACGNAWFVKNFETVPNADAEFRFLDHFSPKDTAVVQSANATALQGLNIQWDSTNNIRLTAYHPDKMEYQYSAKTDQLAVFSEMYYPPSKGWKCYLDGQPAPDFFKVNYLLRGMRLPAGENRKLEMRFEPQSFVTGSKIGMVASAATLLLFFAGLFFWFKGGKTPEMDPVDDFEGQQETAETPKKASVPGKRK